MPTVMSFDNINRLEQRRKIYEEYYAPMRITESQKRKRALLAVEIEDAVLFLFALYLVAREYGQQVDRKSAERQYREQLREALESAGIRGTVIRDYLDDIADEEVRVTEERYKEDDYWTSSDRATTIAQNDANTAWNGEEYADAVASGKTMKQWLTMKDERVRETHVAVDDTSIPIDEYFVVGNSLMRYPRDLDCTDFSEVVNCRCSVQYF